VDANVYKCSGLNKSEDLFYQMVKRKFPKCSWTHYSYKKLFWFKIHSFCKLCSWNLSYTTCFCMYKKWARKYL